MKLKPELFNDGVEYLIPRPLIDPTNDYSLQDWRQYCRRLSLALSKKERGRLAMMEMGAGLEPLLELFNERNPDGDLESFFLKGERYFFHLGDDHLWVVILELKTPTP